MFYYFSKLLKLPHSVPVLNLGQWKTTDRRMFLINHIENIRLFFFLGQVPKGPLAQSAVI
jgi:hypothetical protein